MEKKKITACVYLELGPKNTPVDCLPCYFFISEEMKTIQMVINSVIM